MLILDPMAVHVQVRQRRDSMPGKSDSQPLHVCFQISFEEHNSMKPATCLAENCNAC